MSDSSVLVTGASGFLGRHLLEALEVSRGAPRPVALVRDLCAWNALPWTRALTRTVAVEGALSAPTGWRTDPRLRDVRVVAHLAAHVAHSRSAAAEVFETNVQGTRAAVTLGHDLRARVILMSTSGTVGCFRSPDARALEDSDYCESEIARWPYYASKLAAERSARALADAGGPPLVIVRPPVLIGPRDHRLRASGHVLRVLQGRVPFIPPGGIAFVDVRDAARSLVRLIEHPAPRPIYHLPGFSWTLERFFTTVAGLAGRSLPSLHLPARAVRAIAATLDHLPGSLSARLPDPVLLEMATCFWGIDSRHALAELDHRPRSAEETLRASIEWLRESHPEIARPARGAT